MCNQLRNVTVCKRREEEGERRRGEERGSGVRERKRRREVINIEYKGCLGILQYYNGSVINALMDVYGEIGLERHLFKAVPSM